MEIPASLAAGTGGGPLGTERSSATSPHSSGDLFAREVERASERASGTGAEARRLDELKGERRETRRAGFGQEREPESEMRSDEATLRGEHAPVVAQPARAATEEPSATPMLQASAQPSAAASAGESASPSLPGASEASPSAAAPNMSASNAAAAAMGALRVASELALAPTANSAEPAPVELAQILRTGSAKAAKSAGAASGVASAAMLERAAEILRQIKLHASPGVQRLTLELEPAELGRLSVQLALRAGKVTAIVRAESAATIEALRQHEGELQSMFAGRGIQADSVRFELGFGGARSRGYERARAAAESPRERSAAAPAPQHIPSATPPRASASRLDTYA